jgi:hypothetical protein
MNFIRKTDRMDITVEEAGSNIFVQQKWKYEWLNDLNTTQWTYAQKKHLHDKIDTLIWRKWSGHFKIKTTGNSAFSKKHSSSGFTMNFDIKWVLSNEHWLVRVRKIVSGTFKTSNVKWPSRIINLDTEDILIRKSTRGGRTFYKYPVLHEFGHAIGNSVHASQGMHGDEYKANNPFKSDQSSIMNLGNELRKRHIEYLLQELNKMIPDTTFYCPNII